MEDRRGLIVYQGIAFVALLVTIYVATPPEPRWKVLLIAAIVAAVTSAVSLLWRPRRP